MKDLFKKVWRRVRQREDPRKDQSTGLYVAGLLEMALGILVFSTAMLLMVVLSRADLHFLKPAHVWQMMFLLLFLTGWWIVLGFGSLRARRWARVLILAGSWVTIFFGSLFLSLVLYILPEVHDLMMESGLLPPEAAMNAAVASVLFLLLLQIIIPLLSIAFYSRKSVEATCCRLNPASCWTDRIPLPLLAMGMISVLGCCSFIPAGSFGYVVFFFGHVIGRWSGMIVSLLLSLACGYVAWGAFHRKMHAWWGAYALVLAVSCSLMLTFSGVEMEVLYSRMDFTAEQIVQFSRYRILSPAMLTAVSCIWGAIACIYLVWVRDCFQPEKDKTEVKSYEQVMAERQTTEEEPASRRPRMRLDD